MSFLTRENAIEMVKSAILERKTLQITYQHMGKDKDVVSRKMAPIDLGTTNIQTMESNKNNLYCFCYDHIDKETGVSKPMVHPINIEHIVSIEDAGESFDENTIAEINEDNTGYNYRNCQFAIVPERSWFK